MITENISIKKITAKEGYLLTNGTVTTDTIYLGIVDTVEAWWEIPDPNYIETHGSYLAPIFYYDEMEVTKDLWYTNGDDIFECIKDGKPNGFDDKEYFDVIR